MFMIRSFKHDDRLKILKWFDENKLYKIFKSIFKDILKEQQQARTNKNVYEYQATNSNEKNQREERSTNILDKSDSQIENNVQ